MQNLLLDLEELLKKSTYTNHENLKKNYTDKDGNIIKNKVVELANNLNPDLLRLLLSSKSFKDKFFQEVEGILVFDKIAFIRFISQKNFLPDSYTQFKNEIGLGIEGSYDDYLKENKKIVLYFPYKDCILQGGQTKEDAKRYEVFWNTTLAPDQINRLLDKKIFTNFKRLKSTPIYERQDDKLLKDEKPKIIGYKGQTIENVTELKDNDNFIIKGNNLMALHCLRARYEGKVKLIYIDPPYNTGNDSFLYNDKFNHSSWLVFMKNRLEIARKLLSEDGSIFIQCDDSEQAYLKVLCDEIFGRDNFVVNHAYKRRKTQANLTKLIAPIHENILCFAKNKLNFKINNLPLKEEYVRKMYKNPDNDPRGYWRLAPLLRPENSKNKKFTIKMPDGRSIEGKWSCSQKTFDEYVKDNLLVIVDGGSPNKKIFLKDNEGLIPNSWLENIATTEEASKEVELLFGSNEVFLYSKPEGLLNYILQISTNPNDIVLDFYAGSGTTLAVAHKMGRQYIGIEQMDYIQDIPFIRMEKVIEGEQGGISKAVEWKGGGELVYCELMKYNQAYIDQIQEASTNERLEQIRIEMIEKAFLNHLFHAQSLEENKNIFDELGIDDKKRFLLELLDLNQLYVNLSEAEDKEFKDRLKENDLRLTKQFYKLS